MAVANSRPPFAQSNLLGLRALACYDLSVLIQTAS